MSFAEMIDGKALADKIKLDVTERVEYLKSEGIFPGLAVILIGEDPASAVYVSNKIRSCEAVGIASMEWRLPASIPETELLSLVKRLNEDNSVHGILIQLPLPSHIDSHNVIANISPQKDVDGFHIINAGALMVGKNMLSPCTPSGVMKMLEAYDIELYGKNAVVIGRSNIVGKPMTLMLLQAGATVTNCWHETKDLAFFTKNADVIVTATGVPDVLTSDMIKPGAVVIDVGIIRGEDGKIRGDVDFKLISGIAGYVSPVPGGVGAMTIAMLLVNTIQAAENQQL